MGLDTYGLGYVQRLGTFYPRQEGHVLHSSAHMSPKSSTYHRTYACYLEFIYLSAESRMRPEDTYKMRAPSKLAVFGFKIVPWD